MKTEILEFQAGAIKAQGVTVVIDVFRAVSVACYAIDAGAERVIAVENPAEAFALRKKYKRSILAGESNERIIEGFDIGNSPTEILSLKPEGYTLIHCTTAGTRGLVKAVNASALMAGAIVNASATADFIKLQNPDLVSLVAMGYRAEHRADEDILCARMIDDRLKGIKKNYLAEIEELRDGAGKRFFDPANKTFSPPTDFFLCTMHDRFGFALSALRRDDGNIELMPEFPRTDN
jgi:2-phosphosulfolactate phosphatase